MFATIRRFFKFLHWLYLQYLLNTALYMLEPWERILFSTLLFAILSTAVYSALVFLPHHVRSLIQFYSWSRSTFIRNRYRLFTSYSSWTRIEYRTTSLSAELVFLFRSGHNKPNLVNKLFYTFTCTDLEIRLRSPDQCPSSIIMRVAVNVGSFEWWIDSGVSCKNRLPSRPAPPPLSQLQLAVDALFCTDAMIVAKLKWSNRRSRSLTSLLLIWYPIVD